MKSDKRKCWNITWHSGSHSEKLVGKEDTTHPQNIPGQICFENFSVLSTILKRVRNWDRNAKRSFRGCEAFDL